MSGLYEIVNNSDAEELDFVDENVGSGEVEEISVTLVDSFVKLKFLVVSVTAKVEIFVLKIALVVIVIAISEIHF